MNAALASTTASDAISTANCTAGATGLFMGEGGVVVAGGLVVSYDDDEEDGEDSGHSDEKNEKDDDENLISKLELALMSTERYRSTRLSAGQTRMSSDEFREVRLQHLKEIEYTLTAVP